MSKEKLSLTEQEIAKMTFRQINVITISGMASLIAVNLSTKILINIGITIVFCISGAVAIKKLIKLDKIRDSLHLLKQS